MTSRGSRASLFPHLEDTPANYAGAGGQSVIVKAEEDGLTFGDVGGGGVYSQIVGDGSAVSFDLVHNLGVRDFGGLLAWDVTTSPERQLWPIGLIVDNNTVRVVFPTAPAIDGARVVLLASGGGGSSTAGSNFLDLIEPKVRTINQLSLSADTDTTVDISADIPTDTEAVYINFVCIPGSNTGFFDAWRDGAWPGTSLINYSGANIANMVLVGVTDTGTLRVRANKAITINGDLVGAVRPL